jgi:hypothetical protein
MRTFWLAVLGLLAGLVAGMILTEIIVATAVSEPAALADNLLVALLVGYAPPGLAIIGAVAAPMIGRRLRRRLPGGQARPGA